MYMVVHTIQLRGGATTSDPRLDRVPQFDPKSRLYRAVEGIETRPLRSYSWNKNIWLDQNPYGGLCVGFSLAQEAAARPVVVRGVTDDFAVHIYREAQKIDEWAGEDYEGTSVLAGAKVLHREGYLSEYRWAFGEDDLALVVGYKGPAVLGIPWYESMFFPDYDGFVKVEGEMAGGHAILCAAISLKRDAYRLDNTWGKQWGQNGSCWIRRADLDRLLHEWGEACVPVIRGRGMVVAA
jgi:hypothetical protein